MALELLALPLGVMQQKDLVFKVAKKNGTLGFYKTLKPARLVSGHGLEVERRDTCGSRDGHRRVSRHRKHTFGPLASPEDAHQHQVD